MTLYGSLFCHEISFPYYNIFQDGSLFQHYKTSFWNTDSNSVDQDQRVLVGALRSGSALFDCYYRYLKINKNTVANWFMSL